MNEVVLEPDQVLSPWTTENVIYRTTVSKIQTCLKVHLEGDVRSQVSGILLLVPLNSCFKTFVIFHDWLFPYEVCHFM